jgi:hypothetical protein
MPRSLLSLIPMPLPSKISSHPYPETNAKPAGNVVIIRGHATASQIGQPRDPSPCDNPGDRGTKDNLSDCLAGAPYFCSFVDRGYQGEKEAEI